MTNTLHRFGAPETFQNDYIVFAMPARGVNDADAPAKLQEFLRLAVKHHPINIGNSLKRGLYHSSDSLNPLVHWHRKDVAKLEEVVESIDSCATVAAVFERSVDVEAFLIDLRKADLGISINISSLTDKARVCCEHAGITRHSVSYSLGFHGDLNRLPDRHVLELSTMCGHGMVSHNFAKKMIDLVREGRRTPQEAARCMARFCACGVFNLTRAECVLEKAKVGK